VNANGHNWRQLPVPKTHLTGTYMIIVTGSVQVKWKFQKDILCILSLYLLYRWFNKELRRTQHCGIGGDIDHYGETVSPVLQQAVPQQKALCDTNRSWTFKWDAATTATKVYLKQPCWCSKHNINKYSQSQVTHL
jgi:hypothetical protein